MTSRVPTISDVARASGVSIATVSYVINDGPRNVRPDTRRRVVAAMDALQFHPNSMARGLTRKSLNTIGIVFPHPHPNLVADSYFSAILDGIIHVAVKRKQHVMLYTGLEWHGTDSLPAFRDRRVDGFLVIAALTDSTLVPSLTEVGIPFVQINGSALVQHGGNVDVDNIDAARQVIAHLAALGHRRIAHLAGQPNSPSTAPRREGYRLAMEAFGLAVDPALVLEGSYDQDWGYEGMNRLLAAPNPPTAVFAGGDGIAAGVYKACSERNISIPDQMSVVGFDDAMYASFLNPPLTTMRHPLAEIGAAATTLLLNRLEGTADAADIPAETMVLKAELVVRQSTAPRRSDSGDADWQRGARLLGESPREAADQVFQM